MESTSVAVLKELLSFAVAFAVPVASVAALKVPTGPAFAALTSVTSDGTSDYGPAFAVPVPSAAVVGQSTVAGSSTLGEFLGPRL